MPDIDTAQQHAPSVAGALLNPITQMKYQYLDTWAIPTYVSMMHSGSVGFSPFYLATTAMPWLKKYGANPFDRNASIKDRVVGSITGKAGWSFKGTINSVAAESGMDAKAAKSFTGQVYGNLRKYMAQNRWKSLADVDIYNRVNQEVRAVGGTALAMARNETAIARIGSSLRVAQTVSRVGAAVTPLLAGIALGQAAGAMAGLWFKGSLAAVDYVNAKVSSMRSLEMGGDLSDAYRSAAAVTERQRAMQELARTPINATRFLGSEASYYAGTV